MLNSDISSATVKCSDGITEMHYYHLGWQETGNRVYLLLKQQCLYMKMLFMKIKGTQNIGTRLIILTHVKMKNMLRVIGLQCNIRKVESETGLPE